MQFTHSASRSLRLFALLVFVALTSATAWADNPAEIRIDYLHDIKPLLHAKCYACHGALKQESALRLDTAAFMRKGGDSGAAIVAGDAEASLLIERVAAADEAERMPQQAAPLSQDDIAKLRAWIAQGAAAPADEQPERDPRDHWAFRPPTRPAVPIPVGRISNPSTHDSDGSTATDGLEIRPTDHAATLNPIDAFIAAEHRKRGLIPAPPAERGLLLRRVSFDLIGLPPTRAELHAFLADDSPDAYEKVVQRLLDSPQYGQRWARHWMDVWRYSDWYGRRMVPDVWNSAPQIWRWRDWIVDSLNRDKGYDRMVREMLAADEICPEDDAATVATGYLVRNWYALNPNDWMRNTVEHTAKAFLALTYNCAHCHDHKYDPITQEDYFRLRAFFEPIGIRQDRVPGEADPGPFQEYDYSVLRKIVRIGAVRIYDKNADAPTWFYTGGDERNRVTGRGPIPPGVPAFLSGVSPLKVEPMELPPQFWYPGLRPAIQETVLNECRAAIAQAHTELAAARQAAGEALPPVREQLAQAEAAFQTAAREAEQAGRPGALAGRQSLLLDAATGRRIVQNGLSKVKSLDDRAALGFQLRIVNDAHVNFQLAKDVVKGLTAGYVAFDKGRIMSYQPGSFTEFEAGRYDFAAGQNSFEITLVLKTAEDRCLLTVRSLADEALLVDGVPVALNGWNPVGDPTKAITFDARTGSVALIDEVTLTVPPDANPAGNGDAATPVYLARFDFEPPAYADGRDVVGIDGWKASPFSQAPAVSVVTMTAGSEALREVAQRVRSARRAVEVHEFKLQAAETKRIAAELQLASAEARIAADRAKFAEISDDSAKSDIADLARAAGLAEHEAAVKSAEAEVLTKERLLAAAETKPADDANRSKKIETASKQLADARAALEKARTALAAASNVDASNANADASQPATYTPFSPTYAKTSTGRRRALAEWIANRENPLTARVAVNHIWMRHFHAPLVASVYDFGRSGASPTHPELLDWLAVEFMDSGWSMKHLHRLIVTSNAYRRSSAATVPVGRISNPSEHAGNAYPPSADDTDGLKISPTTGNTDGLKIRPTEVDPENKYLWRMNPGRMEAEVVRDSLLYSAGRLDLQMGGQELENSEALTTRRRSVYYSCHPELDGKSQLGALFDAPEPTDCYRRTRSVIPQQALALTNSELIHELSAALAASLWQALTPEEQSEPQAFITAAYETILTRGPSDAELKLCAEFLHPVANAPAAANDTDSTTTDPAAQRRREGLVRALLNHNDFIVIR